MKYFNLIASSLILNLANVAAQEIVVPTNNYVQSSINLSLESLSKSDSNEDNPQESPLNETHLRAPNSYIYDIVAAKQNGYTGLKIPVKKAFDVWANQNWYLNAPLPSNGILSAYLYWEDTYGLISEVSLETQNPKEDSKIRVKVNPKKGMGNAVVSLHYGTNGNQDDLVIWSWHIWVTDDPSEGVAYGQDMETDVNGIPFTPQFMDRNLGATNSEIVGHNWHKTAGLMYQWGRKDPIPPLMTKDFSFTELNGLVGFMRNREGIHEGNIVPEVLRPFSDISSNLKFAIHNPIALVINTDVATWFSEQQYRIPDNPNTTNVNETVAWDLWSDNMRGEDSNASSSNPTIQADSRSYELKSPYDPCPNEWRIPSHLGRNTVNNIHSPWGRKNSGYNDDVIPANNMFYPNQPNDAIHGAKIYSGVGVDFRNAYDMNNNSRKIGVFPTTGYYVYYPGNGSPSIVYQDSEAISAMWTATYSLGGARYFRVVTDPQRPDLGVFGLNQILVNQTTFSMEAMPVRCIKDPNLQHIGSFETEYISEHRQYFTEGLKNPNSYILRDESEILIPVSKAFSAYDYLFPEREGLYAHALVANVYWTDNPDMVKTVKVMGDSSDPRYNFIRVGLNPDQKGNAIISLHNESIDNPVYWSWHLWSISDEIQAITYVNQENLQSSYHFINPTGTDNPPLTTVFMDRNLGALHDLPVEIMTNPNVEVLQNEAKYSGGLHFQWGRKDPIPSFQLVGGQPYDIYRGASVSESGVVTYQTINSLQYKSAYTEDYSTYKGMANVNSQDDKYQEANKIIQYAIENPLTLLHKGTTESSDWVSGDASIKADRWGHGSTKSIYDPCPKDWRVADTFKVYENGFGSSPWYNGKKEGSPQGIAQPMSTKYGGQFFEYDNKAIGWFFNDPQYQIGHFPTTGIIGKFSPNELGGTSINTAITGVWTASLTQQMKGHALALTMGKLNDSTDKVIATGNISPSYALNVRCALDERRYSGDLGDDDFPLIVRDFSNYANLKNIQFFPNPIINELNASVDKPFVLEVYDLNGRLVKKGKFVNKKIDLSSLSKGIYIGLVFQPDSTETISMKLIKQ